MKYLKLFKSFDIDDINEIRNICKKYDIKNYTINPDVSIDVNTSVNLSYEKLTKLPLKFNKINGYFYCDYNKLATLEGSPKEINGDFNCCNNYLTSFEFAPK